MLRAATLALLCCLSSDVMGQTEQSLLWLKEHAPDKNLQMLDINDSTFQLLVAQLSGVAVSQQQATTPRAAKLLQTTAHTCTGNKLALPERRDWGVISQQPQVIFPGLRLYVMQSSHLAPWLSTLSNQQPLSLQQILNTNHRFTLGFASGRSYGEKLDRLLQQRDPRHHRIIPRVGPDNTGGVVQMFSRGRVDLLIEYPNVVQHYLKQLPEPPAVQSFALAESPPTLPGHIICSDTAEGRALLNQLENAISIVSKQRAYLDAHLRWFSADLHQELTQLYNTAYGTNF